MSVWINSRRALLALALPGTACSIYGTDLLESASAVQGGGGGGAVAGSESAGAGGVVGGNGNGGTTPEPPAAGDGGGGGEGGQVPDPPTVPYLTVAIGAPSISVSLTSEGSLDWAHWGLSDAASYNHKAGVMSQLLDFKPSGSATPVRYLDGPTTFNWSDGTPSASGVTNDGTSWKGVGQGFELTVAAALKVRRLRVYLGVFDGTGQMKAALSDPRANAVGDDRFTSNSGMWSLQVVNIDYGNADKPDTTMTVSWKLDAAPGQQSAVSITALTLAGG